MREDMEVSILDCQKNLRALAAQLNPPEMSEWSHMSDRYLVGNEAAYLLLAASALEAVSGKATEADKFAWFKNRRWGVKFLLESAPQVFVDNRRSRLTGWLPAILFVVGMVLLCLLIVGSYTSAHWIYMGLITPTR